MKGRSFGQLASLSEFRVSTAPPFSKTGVDFAEALFVKGKDGQMTKVYIALFTCCVNKSIDKELRILYGHPFVRKELENRRIQWRFNLERAPWWGGFFERMVGSVKRCLRTILGNARLSFDELLTVLNEVEATLNSRPLTYEYDTPGEEVLTTALLMYGRRLTSLPESAEVIDAIGCNWLQQEVQVCK